MDANNAQRNENESQRPATHGDLDRLFSILAPKVDQHQQALERLLIVVDMRSADTQAAVARIERKVGDLMVGLQMVTSSIEQKLDALIAALAEEDGESAAERTLDGEQAGGERDQTQSL